MGHCWGVQGTDGTWLGCPEGGRLRLKFRQSSSHEDGGGGGVGLEWGQERL